MSVEELLAQLRHPNPHLRERAIVALSEVEDATLIGRLLAVLDEEDVVYRRSAVKALGAIGSETIGPLVDLLEKSENVTVRGSCVKALAQVAINYPEEPFDAVGIEGLKTALSDANPVIYIAAVMALGEIGPSMFEVLVETLRTTDNVALAVAIVNSLGSLGDERGVEVLEAYAREEGVDEYVRESAASALGRLDQVMKFQRENEKRYGNEEA
jgi:bilin biosynthesis protein